MIRLALLLAVATSCCRCDVVPFPVLGEFPIDDAKMHNTPHERFAIKHTMLEDAAKVLREFTLNHPHSLRSVSCLECQSVVAQVVKIVQNSTEYDMVLKLMEGICDAIHPNDPSHKEVCAVTVGIARSLLSFIVYYAHYFDWEVSETICSNIVRVCPRPCCNSSTLPEQLRLSFPKSESVTEIQVTWVTLQATPGAEVVFGSEAWQRSVAEGASATSRDGGWVGIIHNAIMTNLDHDTTYWYRVGSNASGWSRNYSFHTIPQNVGTTERPLRVIAIADMDYGRNGDVTIRRLNSLAESGQLPDVLIHFGDIAYADADMQHWDLYSRMVEPFAARVPYMTTPGNHELWYNFSSYKMRFHDSMPRAEGGAPDDAMYYSFTIGPVQFLMLNTESPIDTPQFDAQQYSWAEQRLKEMNAKRDEHPWIVVAHHRPLYCTLLPSTACVEERFALLATGIEDVYMKGQVDCVLVGHLHNYERTYPVFKENCTARSYKNAPTPFYLINGAAGNREGNTVPSLRAPWSVAASSKIGYQWMEFSRGAGEARFSSAFRDSQTNDLLDYVEASKDWGK